MRVQRWLAIDAGGRCRLTATKPKLRANEVAINLEVDLPNAIFEKPKLEAKITVPTEAARDTLIRSVVNDKMQGAIEQATGLNFVISVASPAE